MINNICLRLLETYFLQGFISKFSNYTSYTKVVSMLEFGRIHDFDDDDEQTLGYNVI